jgi:hypothetical protein
MEQVTILELLTPERVVSTPEDTLDMGCPLPLLMIMPLLLLQVGLEDPRSMAAMERWVEVSETTVVRDQPSRLRPRKV